MEKIKIGIGVSSIGRFLPFIARAAGLFEKENIDAEIVNRQDEEKVVEDLVAESVPIATPNAPSLLFSLLDGNDLVIVGAVLNRPAFYLVATDECTEVESLRGKRVGINHPRRMAGIVMLALLRRWCFDRDRDLALVDLGVNDRSLEALRRNEIDAALLPPEKAFQAEAEGFRVIADSSALDCHWVPLATTRRFHAANRELIKNIRSIYIESIRLFKNDRITTIDEIGRCLPALQKTPHALEKCYRIFAEGFEPTLTPSLRSVDSIIHEVALQDPRARDIRAPSLIDIAT